MEGSGILEKTLAFDTLYNLIFLIHLFLFKSYVFYFDLQVFCGKIPKDMFEDELIVLFEKSGKIWDLRLMMDPMTGTNRGYAFITYTTKDEAQQATRDVSISVCCQQIYDYFTVACFQANFLN